MHSTAFTLGFSNRSWEDTIKILQAFRIERVVDVRTLPGSRRTPQFNLDHLEAALPQAGIDYIHMKSLGGLRKPARSSTLNMGWKNDGFRGYADYMQTVEFQTALAELARHIDEKTSVFCCTEAVFWRCHRQLIADALLVRNFPVGHIFNASKADAHRLTPFARVDGTAVTYPALL
jgi:uncharacterized protein (DUF488 family)